MKNVVFSLFSLEPKKHASQFGLSTVTALRRSGYYTSFERGDLGGCKVTNKLNFYSNQRQFKPGTKEPDFSIPSWYAGVNQHTSTFWSVTLQLVDGNQPTIWQMKVDIHSFHVRYRRLISIHRLQRKIHLPFNLFSPHTCLLANKRYPRMSWKISLHSRRIRTAGPEMFGSNRFRFPLRPAGVT